MFKLSTQRQACSEFLFAPKLEHSNLGRTCLIFRGVDPTFHHKIFPAYYPLHQMAYFRVVWSCRNKQIWLQKKIKWNDVVRGDVAQHVLFYHRKAPN